MLKKANKPKGFASAASHSTGMSGGVLWRCATGVLGQACGVPGRALAIHCSEGWAWRRVMGSSLRKYPLPQNRTKPNHYFGAAVRESLKKWLLSVLFDFSLISLFFWNDLWLSKCYPGPSVLWSRVTVLRNKPQNKLTNNGHKHFYNTWNVEGLSDCFLERGGFTEGLPAATKTCIALQKNRVEIRKITCDGGPSRLGTGDVSICFAGRERM